MITSPLSGQFGLEIKQLDLADDLSAELISELASLVYKHAVVCIRAQALTSTQLANFGEKLGQPIEHNEKNLLLDGLPTVMSLSNADARDDRQLNGGAHWHTDLVHTDEPASLTMLHAVAVPEQGGRTLFANQIAAYEALSEDKKRECESLTVIHCYEGRTDGSMPETRHPLVRKHPVTGRKALYAAADTGIGIVDMETNEAMSFYTEIGEYATREQFIYRHQYQLNDVVIWDNAQLLHAAEVLERAKTNHENRIMHRVSVRGWL